MKSHWTGAAILIATWLGAISVTTAAQEHLRFSEKKNLTPGDLNAALDELQRQIDALKSNPTLPIGTVLSSLLTQEKFLKEYGSGWILADGRSAVGSNYAELTGAANVPDLRGVFLRGKNNGRTDGRENPSGDLPLGEYEADQFQDHSHEYNRSKFLGDTQELYAAAGRSNDGIDRAPTNYIINGRHGSETRPKSATINFFIRIN